MPVEHLGVGLEAGLLFPVAFAQQLAEELVEHVQCLVGEVRLQGRQVGG
jgi:hypothetical protein